MTILFGEIKDTATISNTEYSILDKTTSGVPIAHTTKVRRSIRIRMVSMVAGDEFRGRVYEKTNGGTAEVIHEWTMGGLQPGTYVTPEFQLSEGYDVTLLRTAGTDRVANWNIMDAIGDVNVVSIAANAITATAINADAITAAKVADGTIDAATFAANSITASALATDAVTEIVAGLAAYVYEGTRTVKDFWRLAAAVLWGKSTGEEGSPITFRDDGDTKDRVVVTYVTGDRTPTTRDAT